MKRCARYALQLHPHEMNFERSRILSLQQFSCTQLVSQLVLQACTCSIHFLVVCWYEPVQTGTNQVELSLLD